MVSNIFTEPFVASFGTPPRILPHIGPQFTSKFCATLRKRTRNQNGNSCWLPPALQWNDRRSKLYLDHNTNGLCGWTSKWLGQVCAFPELLLWCTDLPKEHLPLVQYFNYSITAGTYCHRISSATEVGTIDSSITYRLHLMQRAGLLRQTAGKTPIKDKQDTKRTLIRMSDLNHALPRVSTYCFNAFR